jgi:hypothetical protein
MLADRLLERMGSRQRARRMLGIVAQSLCAMGWLGAIVAPNVHVFTLSISLAALCNDIALPSAWAT